MRCVKSTIPWLGRCVRLGVRMGGWALAGSLLGVPAGRVAWAETPPKPAVRVQLAGLGFPGYVVSLLHAGASMATVHALDSTHVLFTYSLRSLVPRVPGDDVNDSDREVAAVLVETPSGKVLARTKWHLHDHGRYLWSVGRGVFVVRIGNDLSAIAPLQGLTAADGEAFRRYALPHRPGLPVLVAGSPDGRMIMAEMESERPPAANENEGAKKRKHYTVEFFRLNTAETPGAPVRIDGAGAVGSPVLLRLAVDGDGYLWAEDAQRGQWKVSFNEFGGKQQKLTPVLSSCNPRLSLLSRSEFLVETCRGSEQQPMLASFGFDGQENWQEPFGEALQPPTLALAPEAGRFAMSRLVASSDGAPVSSLVNADPLTQEIRVYQNGSGNMLLRVRCAPAVRSAENFDLAPDGKSLVVLGPETLDFYRLPELSARDRKDLAEAQTMTPPVGTGPVVLAGITRPIAAPESVGGGDTVRRADEETGKLASTAPATVAATATVAAGGEPAKASPAVPAAALATPSSAQAVANAGDPAPGGVRKPPTLLKPGESPDFKGQSSAPK